MPLGRLLILIVAFGLMAWFFIVPSLDEPTIRGPVSGTDSGESSDAEVLEPRTREEAAVWREQLDRRLYR